MVTSTGDLSCRRPVHTRVLPFGFEADGFQVRPGREGIRCAGVNQKKPFPEPVRVGGVRNPDRYVCRSHVFLPPFDF